MTCANGRNELLMQIYQCEFTLVDINLYLDTHPECQRAIADYNCYAEQLKMLKDRYNKEYGPMENFGHSVNMSGQKWLYGTQNFPWQPDYMEV